MTIKDYAVMYPVTFITLMALLFGVVNRVLIVVDWMREARDD